MFAGVGVREGATGAEVERLVGKMLEMLEVSGYVRRHPANSDAEQVRRLVMRMGVSGTDAEVWMGILRQALWAVRNS